MVNGPRECSQQVAVAGIGDFEPALAFEAPAAAVGMVRRFARVGTFDPNALTPSSFSLEGPMSHHIQGTVAEFATGKARDKGADIRRIAVDTRQWRRVTLSN